MAENPTAPGTLRVLLFGASGMVGAAVLDQCLRDPRVTAVLAVGRTPSGRTDPKLRDLLHADLFDVTPIVSEAATYDACFFTAGVSSAGMKEPAYTRVTYDMTLAVAAPLAAANPHMAFLYISGAGTDATERGRSMWARVKGRTENALLALPFERAIMLRLGGLVPVKGFKSKTRLYRIFYSTLGPLMPAIAKVLPKVVTTPSILGRAMIAAALGQAPSQRLSAGDIHRLGRG